MTYTTKQSIVDGQLVTVKVYKARNPRVKKYVMRVGGSTRAVGGLAIAQQGTQILRCNKCNVKISRAEEQYKGTCYRC